MQPESNTWILTAHCESRLGTVDALTAYLRRTGNYITELNSFDDRLASRFFIRAVFRSSDSQFDEQAFREGFAEQAEPFAMEWSLTPVHHRTKVVIMVSKYDHCLNDLLYRYRTGHLPIEITAIISNHPDLRGLADWHGIPYHHFPITPESKLKQENQVWDCIQQAGAELVVLARYMQVLSPAMCERLDGWAINIHHSLLPGFKGARPYHQAYEKGVKLVGATAHYVNNALDEGPIITQGVQAVDHAHYPEDLVAKGQDIECITLARAVSYHIEKRVFLHGNRTVVFPS
ncbi:formyltetrahydrofolate deformylase [Pokkaliibacter plantistimulans]|uniref:Formyltetrahydrofolate deformylase n=1 Tax=Proteobacteria bacterium 228 TaxID=2083153 RepID=A0A2S5KIX8_9PROT|nr:formyltetrahydrofolate deformylase [Pokkaliibacter plantistimulans]PPC74563.1 formyltetrahydrofolate deformylase [Pokkaliibacter plantistimulans]